MRGDETRAAIERLRFVLVLDGEADERGDTAHQARRAGVAALAASVEPETSEAVTVLVRSLPDALIGASGVSTAAQAWAAAEAGARFVVATPLDAEIAAICEAADALTVAYAADEGSLAHARMLRPGLVLVPPSLAGSAVASGDGCIVLLDDVDEQPVRGAIAAGAVAVAVRWSGLAEDEPAQRLRLLALLVDAASRAA